MRSAYAPDIRRTCTRRTSPRRGTAGLQGKPRGAVRGCGASSRAGWLGGIPPAPPARESACPRARLSRPPLTPRASSCGRLRAEGRRCAVRGHIPSRHVPVVRRDRPRLESCPQAHQRPALVAKRFREAGHEASQVGRSGAAADKRICVQGAQAVFRQAILRVKTRRMRPRHLRSPG